MLTLASALREILGVQLYKNNARALLSRILSILNLDWLQHACAVRVVYEYEWMYAWRTKVISRPLTTILASLLYMYDISIPTCETALSFKINKMQFFCNKEASALKIHRHGFSKISLFSYSLYLYYSLIIHQHRF